MDAVTRVLDTPVEPLLLTQERPKAQMCAIRDTHSAVVYGKASQCRRRVILALGCSIWQHVDASTSHHQEAWLGGSLLDTGHAPSRT
eukprot:5529641-Amphidinium_carterae.1